MGNACNFAKDDEELEFEKHLSSRKEPRNRDANSTSDSLYMPLKHPMRYDEIEPDFLSSEVGLVYIHELHYANGAIYKG